MNVHRLWSHETSLAAEASSAARARAFVIQHLLDHDLAHLADDIELVVSELATNAMAHAQTPFSVTLCAFDDTVVLEVSDASRAEPSLMVARALDTSGRGVAIVQALSRDWGGSLSRVRRQVGVGRVRQHSPSARAVGAQAGPADARDEPCARPEASRRCPAEPGVLSQLRRPRQARSSHLEPAPGAEATCSSAPASCARSVRTRRPKCPWAGSATAAAGSNPTPSSLISRTAAS